MFHLLLAVACLAAASELPALTRLAVQNRTTHFELVGTGPQWLVAEGGLHCIVVEQGHPLHIEYENQLEVPTLLHPHGLQPPNGQDGVPFISSHPVMPGGVKRLSFFTRQPPGTYWLHSHYGTQADVGVAAPLIVTGRLPDTYPLAEALNAAHNRVGVVAMITTRHDGKPGFLINGAPPEAPAGARVAAGRPQLLRVVNGAGYAGFRLQLPAQLSATIVAVDGQPVQPVTPTELYVELASRIDLLLHVPANFSAAPLFAIATASSAAAGNVSAGGFWLRASSPLPAALPPLPAQAAAWGTVVPLLQTQSLRVWPPSAAMADAQVAREIDIWLGHRRHSPFGLLYAMNNVSLLLPPRAPLPMAVDITGAAAPSPVIAVQVGQRVCFRFHGHAFPHPMHMHGHDMVITHMHGVSMPASSPPRDIVNVPGEAHCLAAGGSAHSCPLTARVCVDFINVGRWAFHCHFATHLWNGMLTVLDVRPASSEDAADGSGQQGGGDGSGAAVPPATTPSSTSALGGDSTASWTELLHWMGIGFASLLVVAVLLVLIASLRADRSEAVRLAWGDSELEQLETRFTEQLHMEASAARMKAALAGSEGIDLLVEGIGVEEEEEDEEEEERKEEEGVEDVFVVPPPPLSPSSL